MFGSRNSVTPNKSNNDPPISTGAPQGDSGRFSLIELRRIHQQLIETKQVTEENKSLVIEILRVIAEMVVYGDNKSELLFDFFCEKNMLSLFLEIMWTKAGCPLTVHVQILQTLSILISSVKNDTSLYYLLSNNHINDIITFPHNFQDDESLVAQFASFIKTSSLRLNEQTVQFFFNEDTGAFPLLTKAIELIQIPDPMIRISAQTTILNVYQVNDDKARAYALQEDVLQVLFDAITKIMKEQVTTLQNHSIAYIKASKESNETMMIKLEQSVDDCFISLEDWLYYLQDIIDLNIAVLQKSFVCSLLNEFLLPAIVQPILDFIRSQQDLANIQARKSSLEIDDYKSGDARQKTVSHGEIDSAVIDVAKINVLLFYALQMFRILSSPLARLTFMTALFHPLSTIGRVIAYETSQTFKEDQVSKAEDAYQKSDSDSFNMNRDLTKLLSFTDFPRTILLFIYSYNVLISGYAKSFEPPSGSKVPANKWIEKVFSALGIMPKIDNIDLEELLVDLSEIESARIQSIQNTTYSIEENKKKKIKELNLSRFTHLLFHPDLIPLEVLVKLSVINSNNQLELPQLLFYNIAKVLRSSHQHSLIVIQVSVQTLSLIHHIADKSEPSENDTSMTQLESEIRGLGKLTSSNLSTFIQEGQFSEMILILVNEEIKRYKNRKWNNYFPKMYSDKSLLLSSVSTGPNPFGIDFELPISQIENLRKEIQTFLMLRGLYLKLKQSKSKNVQNFSGDSTDFFTYIDDKTFLVVDEDSIIPTSISEDKYFDMKGRKFLDCVAVGLNSSLPGTASSNQSTPNSSSASTSSSLLSVSSSVFSLGLGGSKKNSPVPTSAKSSPVPPTISSTKKGKERDLGAGSQKLLFVQDPNLVILVSQQKIDGKSSFKVFAIIPILYADAKVDLNDKCKFRLVARSWKNQPNLIKNESDVVLSEEMLEAGSPRFSKRFSQRKVETFLKPPEKSTFYHLSIIMETEQACSLAVQHIETRRKTITNQKIEKLKTILGKWSGDCLDEELE